MTHRLRYHNMLVSPRVGGGEKLAMQIHQYLERERPGSSELLVPAHSATQEWAKADGQRHSSYALEWLCARARGKSLFANAALWLKGFNSDRHLLHVHSPFVYGALRPFFAATRTKRVLHLHLDYTEEQLLWPLTVAPDLIFCCARFMKARVERVLARNGMSSKIAVAVNAVDLERFRPGDRTAAKMALGVRPGCFVLLMAANLAPHKGQETAIKALTTLLARSMSVELWLVGEERESGGLYTDHLHELTKQLGVKDAVRFLGFRGDVPALLHAADCLLLPSTSEGLPLSILEAQASKTVVLAAPTAGIPEVIEHGRTGFLIDAKDHETYAKVLAALHDNPALAETIRETAYTQVTGHYGLPQYCRGILRQYDELVDIDRP